MLKQCVLLVVVIIFFSVCSGQAQVFSSKPYKVGVLYWSMDIPGQVAMRRGLEAATLSINQHIANHGGMPIRLITAVAGNGEKGIESQIVQMRDLIKQKVDIIIVQPTDNAALARPLLEANRQGIPVVAYDQYISGGQLHSYITSNNYQAGFLDGEYIASKFDSKKPIKIVLVDYPHVSSTVQRVDGFLDALAAQHQAYQILSTYEAVEPVGGKLAVQAILRDFPDKNSIDVIFSVNDGGGLSIAIGLMKAKRNEVLLATVDGDPMMVSLLNNNSIVVIDSAQFCASMGKEALHTAYAILQGKTVPQQKLLPTYPVTKETLSNYPGWYGDIPDNFTKPWKAIEPVWSGDIIRKTEAH